MLYHNELHNLIFHMHEHLQDINEIKIISGYISCEPISSLCELAPKAQITVIYGMYGKERIKVALHNELLILNEKYANLNIRYATVPIHSKLYSWYSGNNIENILIGSANFSESGLMNDEKEVLSELSKESYQEYKNYYDYTFFNSVPCTDKSIVTTQMIIAKKSASEKDLIKRGICRLTLLIKKKKQEVVPMGSGINWGWSDNGHNKGTDAEIRIRSAHIKNFPQFFPAKKTSSEKNHIEFIWDDGTVMKGSLEGNSSHKGPNGELYPKQLCSYGSKNILGNYLHKRLNVPNDRPIRISDLKKYGKTYIDFSLLSEGVYYLDFSTTNKK